MDTLRMARWVAPLVLATGFAAAIVPKTAHAQEDQGTRVIVDIADVVVRGGQPYYRYGGYRDADRLVVGRDRYGRPVYYRIVDRRDWRDRDRDRHDPDRYAYRHHRRHVYRPAYPAYGYGDPTARRVTCNKYGNCTVTYYEPGYPRYRP
jgi:hypothetical protein